METNLTVNRTPEIIAAEINSIKTQTMQMVLSNSIEIGRRLVEAKSMVEHGEWSKWLETRVDFSQSTANNLMRLFNEYGADQITLFGATPKSQALGNLSYTQAVALLAVPAEEREQFVTENDVEHMSTRELQQAIKERDEANKSKQELERKLAAANKEAEKAKTLEKDLLNLKAQLEKEQSAGNEEEVKKLQTSLSQITGQLKESQQKVEELSLQLKEKPVDVPAVVEKVPDEVAQELNDLRSNKQLTGAVQKYSIHFEILVKEFNDLLNALGEINQIDQSAAERYKGAVVGLITKMSERLS